MPNIVETLVDLDADDEQVQQDSSEGVYCEHCNSLILFPEEAIETSDGHYFCNVIHASAGGYSACHQCHEWHLPNTMIAVNSWCFCSEECISDYGYSEHTCDHCGYRIFEDDLIEIEGNYYCCSDCAYHDGWRLCSDCNCWIDRNDYYLTYDGRTICPDCRDNYNECNRCGDLFHDDDIEYDEDEDEYYCRNCMRNSDKYVHHYGWTPILHFFGESAIHPYLGVELEIDEGNKSDCAKEIYSNFDNWIYMTNDSSLSSDGIELTSHPMTTEEHLCGRWEKVFSVARKHGYTSHDNGNCGLHVHINRNYFGKHPTFQCLAGQKLATMFDRFQAQLRSFSRRRDDRWCSYSSDLLYLKRHDDKNMRGKAMAIMDEHCGHSRAVNFEHSKTFEIRIFRGTLNLNTFYASLILIDAFARAVKSHSTTWCENVPWYEFIEWAISTCDLEKGKQAFAEYLYSKGLIEEAVYYDSKVKTFA